MTEFLQNFHFLRPWFLLFLLVPLVLYLKKFKTDEKISSWEDICDRNLLDFLLVEDSNTKRISVKKFIYTGLIAATIAAAGPTWQKVELPTFSVENPNMFVLSLAQDMQLKDITPSRLERAKFMISDITDNLSQGQFGLEVYSQEPYVITPLTDDVQLIKNLLPQIVADIVPDYGDRLDRSINLALERFQSAQYANGNIILFTSDVGQRFDLALDAVKRVSDTGYTISVVDTSYDGNEKLKLLVDTGKGVYLSVKNVSSEKLTKFISDSVEERVKLSKNLRSQDIDFGYYLLFIPLLCVLAFFRKGMLVLLLCCLSFQAQAGFLLNDNQEGFRLFNQGKYEEALQKFKDFNWRGISLYKQDKLEEAVNELEKGGDDEAFYNKGVILTKLCKYEEALKAFTEALKLNPQNNDAKYNRQVLTDLFEKAKDNPQVLECKDNNQQQSNNNQENKEDQQDKENSQQNNKSQQQEEQQQERDNGNSSEQNEEKQQPNSENNQEQQNSSSQQQQDKEEQNSDNGSSSEQNEQKQPQNSENKQDWQNENRENNQQDKNSSDNQETSSNNSENSRSNSNNDNGQGGKQDQPSSENSNGEGSSSDTPTESDNDSGPKNTSKNKDGNDNNGTENQQQQQEVSSVGAKKGDENQDYDEEALAMQRRYREIPEDVGGLLREFIRKEYMKDRYNDENK